ncbi:hypothetical protein [Clostridium chrysemydis]|nr:hypothetical protein [Clostridium chrysemydis]
MKNYREIFINKITSLSKDVGAPNAEYSRANLYNLNLLELKELSTRLESK